MKFTYQIEIPDTDIKSLEKSTNSISDGNVGWGEVVEDILTEAVRKISENGKLIFVGVDN